jgi:hypothetical protein
VAADYIRRRYDIDPLNRNIDRVQISNKLNISNINGEFAAPLLYFVDDSVKVFRWFVKSSGITVSHFILAQSIYVGAKKISSYIIQNYPGINPKYAIDNTFNYIVANKNEDYHIIERDECIRDIILSEYLPPINSN